MKREVPYMIEWQKAEKKSQKLAGENRRLREALAAVEYLSLSCMNDHDTTCGNMVNIHELAEAALSGEPVPLAQSIKLNVPVYVENEQFTGYGIAQYDTGQRKRVIGVLLENGNTWEYDAETVRNALPDEYHNMPRIIQAAAPVPPSAVSPQYREEQ